MRPRSQLYRLRQPTRILVLAALILSACSASSGDPAKAVEQYLQAKVGGDRYGVLNLLCSAMQADADRELQSFAGINAHLDGMACTRDGDANSTTTVTCRGAVDIPYGGETKPIPLGKYRVVQEDGKWKWCGEAK